jgi:hypothetical protein
MRVISELKQGMFELKQEKRFVKSPENVAVYPAENLGETGSTLKAHWLFPREQCQSARIRHSVKLPGDFQGNNVSQE